MPFELAELDAHLARHPLGDRRGLDAARSPSPSPLPEDACASAGAGSGRLGRLAVAGGVLLLLGGGLLLGLLLVARVLLRLLLLLGLRLLVLAGVIPLGAVAEPRDRLADRQRVALLGDDAEHAVGVGLVGHVGLVGLDLDELLAAFDLVPVGLQPLEDRALLHRVGQAGHRDVGHARQRTRKRARCPLSAAARASRPDQAARSAARCRRPRAA